MKKTKFLFIDDSATFLDTMSFVFFDLNNVIFAKCNSVKEAMKAIKKNSPDVIFLDHCLTENTVGEGLEIAMKVGKEIKLYSTSASRTYAESYKQYGIDIEYVGKNDLGKLKSIIGA